MSEGDIFKQGLEDFADLSEAEIILAVRALLDQDSGRFEPFEAIVAEESVALKAFVRIGWNLIANDALEQLGGD